MGCSTSRQEGRFYDEHQTVSELSTGDPSVSSLMEQRNAKAHLARGRNGLRWD